jgi:chemotaxis protein methyltransferase CheR
MLARADKACFTSGSLRELPPPLVSKAFDRERQYREGIEFLQQDLRLGAPPGPFDLILCRYVAFTYFSLPLQAEVLLRIRNRLFPEGYLVIGGDERLPRDDAGLVPLAGAPQTFVRQSPLAA